MRKILWGLIVTLLAATIVAAPAGAKQAKCSINKNGKTLSVAAPAVSAHIAHGDTLAAGEEDEACLAAAPGGGALECLDLPGSSVTVADTDASGAVTSGDVLTVLLERDFEVGANGSITLRDKLGAEATFDSSNATFAEENGQLVITVTATPTATLTFDDLAVQAASDIGCEALVTGTLTTKNGTPALKTSSGETLKVKAKDAKAEKRLEQLAKKQAKIEAKGLKSGKTLKVSGVKAGKRN